MAILTISMKALESEIQSFPQKEFFSTLDVSDWEAQQLVLDKHKEGGKEELDSPTQKHLPNLSGKLIYYIDQKRKFCGKNLKFFYI